MNYLIAFAISFVSCAFKALQNRNYNWNNYAAVIPTSCCIAACDLWLLSLLIKSITLGYVLVVGFGNGFGGLLGMKLHDRWFKPPVKHT